MSSDNVHSSAQPVSFLIEIQRAAAKARSEVASISTLADVDDVRRNTIGKSGSLSALRRGIGSLPAEARKQAGKELGRFLNEITEALNVRERELFDSASSAPTGFDATLPTAPIGGGLHPTVQMMYDLNDAFAALNFSVYSGPEISSELYEFDYLNFPPDHPARENMDTYWLDTPTVSFDGRTRDFASTRLCLRPHLTGASIRYMQTHTAPMRVVYPGRVYRNESTDARHERAFFQYEVLLIDRNVTLTSGKFLVDTILRTVFGRPVEIRMRTGFFPFVEPGFEIDMKCSVCDGAGCRTCHQVGWLEVMPGGAPHPNVLSAGGLDPAEWTGFYVNVGLDRLAMMRYGIDDVRLMHSADLRYLTQFN